MLSQLYLAGLIHFSWTNDHFRSSISLFYWLSHIEGWIKFTWNCHFSFDSCAMIILQTLTIYFYISTGVSTKAPTMPFKSQFEGWSDVPIIWISRLASKLDPHAFSCWGRLMFLGFYEGCGLGLWSFYYVRSWLNSIVVELARNSIVLMTKFDSKIWGTSPNYVHKVLMFSFSLFVELDIDSVWKYELRHTRP